MEEETTAMTMMMRRGKGSWRRGFGGRRVFEFGSREGREARVVKADIFASEGEGARGCEQVGTNGVL
jgi:hypothetical protein